MSRKTKKLKRPKARSKSPPLPVPTNRQNRIWRATRNLWSLFAAFVLILSLYIAVKPRHSVTASEIIDPKYADSSPFVLKNDGYFSLYRIHGTCFPGNDMAYGNRPAQMTERFQITPIDFAVLPAGETRSFVCVNVLDVESNAVIARQYALMNFTYRLISWLPWSRNKQFEFVSGMEADHKWRWMPQAPETVRMQ